MSVFNFNHIDKTKTTEEIQEIKELYKYYHYGYWCYQKAYKYFKKLNLLINVFLWFDSNWSGCGWFDS